MQILDCSVNLEDLRKFLAEKKRLINQKKSAFLQLEKEVLKETITPTSQEWKEMFDIATRPGNKLTEEEHSLLPGDYSEEFNITLFSDDSSEIIEPPVVREVLAFYNEEITKIKTIEEELDYIDWKSLDDKLKFLEEIENRFYEETENIEVANNELEKINEKISSHKGKISLIMGIVNLPFELRIEVAAHYHLLREEEDVLDELEEADDRFNLTNSLSIEEIQEILNSNSNNIDPLTNKKKPLASIIIKKKEFEKVVSNCKKEISRFICGILDQNFEECVETQSKERKLWEKSQLWQKQHNQSEFEKNLIYEMIWEIAGLKSYLSQMTENNNQKKPEKSIKRLAAIENNLNWRLDKEKRELTQIQTELYREQFTNRSLNQKIQKLNQKIKVKSDKNIELIKKLWDVQQELKDKETTIYTLTDERNNLQTQLETTQQELSESKHLVVEEQDKLTKQKEHCAKEKQLWEELSAKQKLEAQEIREKEIVDKLIKELGLSTRERERERENILELVITEIKNKLTPPTDNKNKPNLEVAKIIESSKQLGIVVDSKYIERLKNSSNYQKIFDVYSQATKEKLESINSEKKMAQNLNYWLGALSVGSLLILAFMLVRMTKKGRKRKKNIPT